MDQTLAKGIVKEIGPQKAKELRDASRLLDLIDQRKREGRVRILTSKR